MKKMQNWQENIPMTKDKFWKVIDNARAIAPALEGEPLRESLYKQLLKLSPDELVGFDCAWQEYRRIANSPQLIAAACIINGGTSDDRFDYFKNWLILQGQYAFGQALKDPDALAEFKIPFDDTEWEDCGYLTSLAFVGRALPTYFAQEGMVSTIITQSGSSGMSSVTLPQKLVDAINNVGFWDSIPLWAVTLIGGLLITVLSFTMILTVYGRMFSLWMYAAIAPIPLSTFAGEPTSSVGKNFIRSYAGVCLQGVVIALSCIIFSAISSSPPAVDTGASVVTAVWTYVGELAFNLLVLVGAIKGCDRIVKEIMGL